MLQKLPIALAQAKAGNSFKNLLNEIRLIYIFCIEQNKLLMKITTLHNSIYFAHYLSFYYPINLKNKINM